MIPAWTAPLALVSLSLAPAVIVFLLGRDQALARNTVNMVGAGLKLLVVGLLLLEVGAGERYSLSFDIGPGLTVLLRIDSLSLLFVTLSALLWFVTTLYAIGYLDKDPEQRRFFGFFSLCVSATVGIALSGNLFTFFIFYELLTLSTLPLVAHKGNDESLAAAGRYLRYTLGGSAALLVGILWLQALTGSGDFAPGASTGLKQLAQTAPGIATVIFVLMVSGLAVKGAMIPVHGWLPSAMVAPAPVSALLHAVAVVKAGAFGIVRVVLDVYGVDVMGELGLGLGLALAASITILGGSLLAVRQTAIKKRLAFSTVSQVSYIMLGLSLLSPLGQVGALVHLVHQGLMKITLFFCAGILEKTLGITQIAQLDGVGRRLPVTMLAFSIAALGMIGLPPMAGFISKWHLGLGALQADMDWIILVLAGSTLLNAAYFLPLVYRCWFREPQDTDESAMPKPASVLIVGPALFTASAALMVGLFAGLGASPLQWVLFIIERRYMVPG